MAGGWAFSDISRGACGSGKVSSSQSINDGPNDQVESLLVQVRPPELPAMYCRSIAPVEYVDHANCRSAGTHCSSFRCRLAIELEPSQGTAQLNAAAQWVY